MSRRKPGTVLSVPTSGGDTPSKEVVLVDIPPYTEDGFDILPAVTLIKGCAVAFNFGPFKFGAEVMKCWPTQQKAEAFRGIVHTKFEEAKARATARALKCKAEETATTTIVPSSNESGQAGNGDNGFGGATTSTPTPSSTDSVKSSSSSRDDVVLRSLLDGLSQLQPVELSSCVAYHPADPTRSTEEVCQAVRYVFACTLWHLGLAQDGMASAAYLRFNWESKASIRCVP